jgi:hypothetical protein
MQLEWERRRMHATFWSKNQKERYHQKDSDAEEKIILKLVLDIYCVGVCIGFIWLRIETSGGLFVTR